MATRRLLALWLLAGVACRAPAPPGPEAVATVAGTPILVRDLQRAIQRQVLAVDDDQPPRPSASQVQAVLEALIEHRLLMRAAEKKPVHVSHETVEAAYRLQQQGWDEAQWTARLQQQDLTPAELKRALREHYVVRTYLQDYVLSRLSVTDAEVEALALAQPELLQQPETVRAQHLVVGSSALAQRLARQIRAGQRFEDAAHAHSLSPDGKSGGDLGYFARGQMPSPFDEVCFSLAPHTLSRVVSSPYGFHLFYVVEKRPARTLTLAARREALEAQLRRDKERQLLRDTVAQLRGAADVHIEEARLATLY